ncbi:MAG: hypothetical protein F6K30_26635 [Cyanothece sp. SIO2G6]|nr:hypothetical protein [Cyanothece sp. SIO2G6]
MSFCQARPDIPEIFQDAPAGFFCLAWNMFLVLLDTFAPLTIPSTTIDR